MGKLIDCSCEGKYYNFKEILPFQRIFNFINGPRSIGKTYTVLKWLIGKAMKEGKLFAYICRTQDEKKRGVMKFALEKVVSQEFPNWELGTDTFLCTLKNDEETVPLGFCIALSESLKMKKYSFPDVHYMIFDEYMLEGTGGRYVQGWKEPDLLLSIFHTIDREENRLKCFLMGNNTSFYNPYHLHAAFQLPLIPEGKIWMNKTCLFQRAVASPELEESREGNLFLRTIEGSDYGNYALGNEYVDDEYEFIAPLSDKVRYMATLRFEDRTYGLYKDIMNAWFTISEKTDETYFMRIAMTKTDIAHDASFYNFKDNAIIKIICNAYKSGDLRFESMAVKTRFLPGLMKILR